MRRSNRQRLAAVRQHAWLGVIEGLSDDGRVLAAYDDMILTL
ncbi:MAG: hypothetical protein ACXW2A_15950 [Burkholderiales bacterium]